MSLTISRRLALAAAATLAAAGAALAQQDGQIVTAQDIARACQRTHRNPQATAEPTTVGRYGIELNCRLINAAGFTLARVAPEEVCEMLTGRRDWYRGDGTQVICRGTPVALNAPGPAPAPGGPGGVVEAEAVVVEAVAVELVAVELVAVVVAAQPVAMSRCRWRRSDRPVPRFTMRQARPHRSNGCTGSSRSSPASSLVPAR